MDPVRVELDQDLVAVGGTALAVEEAARELIVLELYRQGEVSSVTQPSNRVSETAWDEHTI